MLKRVACLVLALVIITGVFATEALAASTWGWTWWDADTSSVTIEEFARNRLVADNQVRTIHQGFERASIGYYIFPDFYAGPALDADGRLVIAIVASGLEEARAHVSIGPLLEAGVQYKLVEFSLAELFAEQSVVREARRERIVPTNQQRWWRLNWCRYANNATFEDICAANNRVAVRLHIYNDAMVAGFRRYVYDSPMIMFEQGSWICLGGGQGTIMFAVIGAAVLPAIAAAAVIVIVIKRRRRLAAKR